MCSVVLAEFMTEEIIFPIVLGFQMHVFRGISRVHD